MSLFVLIDTSGESQPKTIHALFREIDVSDEEADKITRLKVDETLELKSDGVLDFKVKRVT